MLPRLRSDLLPALLTACDGELGQFDLRWREQAAVAMAAWGCPAAPEVGTVIDGLDGTAGVPEALVFHAGTRMDRGTVLTLVGMEKDLVAARRVNVSGGGCGEVGLKATTGGELEGELIEALRTFAISV